MCILKKSIDRNAETVAESLTSQAYWDRVWQRGSVPKPLDPTSRALRDFARIQWHSYFQHIFSRTGLPSRNSPARLLEVGCGGSVFLPYFRKEYGFEVAGIDYSVAGCAKSHAIHRSANIAAEIHQADMFAPPEQLRGAFDVACSFGLVEHFRPTETAISAVAQFCKPGGYVLTTVPNLRGFPGALQTRINRAVYDLHVPLSPDELAAAHTRCGLEVIECGSIGTLNLMVLNFSGDGSRIPEILGLLLAASISRLAWTLHRLGLAQRSSPTTSPYLGCLARVPE